MRFKINWASLIVGSKSTVFASFYFAFEGNFPSTNPQGVCLYLEGRFNRGFFALLVWGLIFGGAYTWISLFLEFYGTSQSLFIYLLIYYTHIEIIGDPYNLIGSQQCDLFTNHYFLL